MFDFVINPDFLNTLAAIVGPLAFFAAPTEEIENLLLSQAEEPEIKDLKPRTALTELGVAEAA